MSKCKYLLENAGKVKFDEIAECPRFLDSKQQFILLDDLGCRLAEFGGKLQKFVIDYQNSEISFEDFFDKYYKDLYRAYNLANRAIDSCHEVTYIRFCGKDYLT